MNKFYYFLCSLLCLAAVSACADSDEPENSLSGWVPILTEIKLTETLTSDSYPVNKSELYTYEDNLLTCHTTIQEVYGQGNELLYSQEQQSHWLYEKGKATLTDENGQTMVYKLDANGLAVSCTGCQAGQEREYRFSYAGGYLTRIEEWIDGALYASTQLDYQKGELQTVTSGNFSIRCQSGDIVNQDHLPLLLTDDIPLLSAHTDAIYAHLLGRQSQHLVAVVTPAEDAGRNRTSYQYQTDAQGHLSRLTASTTSHGVSYDAYGNATESTRTYTRIIQVSIR